MSESNKATAVAFFEAQDRLRGGPADELCAEGYTARLAGFPTMDLDGHKAFAASFYGAVSDLEHRIEEVLAEDDRVVVRFRLAGTNDGEFMGIPASGKPVDVGALAIMRIESDRVAEVRGEFDQMGLMQQIGAVPAP